MSLSFDTETLLMLHQVSELHISQIAHASAQPM